MSRFVKLPKDGTHIMINTDHIHAVVYTPTNEPEPQTVKLMGLITPLRNEAGMEIYGHSVIETATFSNEAEANDWIEENFMFFNR